MVNLPATTALLERLQIDHALFRICGWKRRTDAAHNLVKVPWSHASARAGAPLPVRPAAPDGNGWIRMPAIDEEDFYADEARLAIHLEMEWSDFLTAPEKEERSSIEWPNPLIHRVRPRFYQEVSRHACDWLAQCRLAPTSYCEVGGGAGRATYEFAKALPALQELVLIEPSNNLTTWARYMLAGGEEIRSFPGMAGLGEPEHDRTAFKRPAPIADAARRLSIYKATAEQVSLPDGSYQLVTCLNVVDRHPDPQGLLRFLHRILAPDGLLVLASPLDFLERYTPRASWVTDLESLFDPHDWLAVGAADVPFDVRKSSRCWTRYVAQVLGKAKQK